MQRQQLQYNVRLTEKLLECGHDTHGRHLILHQLGSSEGPLTEPATKRQLDILPPTTAKDVVACPLAGMPSCGRRVLERPYRVLVWFSISSTCGVWVLLSCFRTVSCYRDSRSRCTHILRHYWQRITGEREDLYKGLFIVRHDEVHVSHLDAPKFPPKHNQTKYDANGTPTPIKYRSLPLLPLHTPSAEAHSTRSHYSPTDLLRSPNSQHMLEFFAHVLSGTGRTTTSLSLKRSVQPGVRSVLWVFEARRLFDGL